MNIHPLLLGSEAIRHIWEGRALLAVKERHPSTPALSAEGHSLGLAHEIFTLELRALAQGEKLPLPVGVRVLELKGQTPVAFYDIDNPQSGEVGQMSATSPYLPLFSQALEMIAGTDAGPHRFNLRLLRVPALNFEALWLHSGKGADDTVVPLRGFHGFVPMQRVPYREALERLRGPAQQAARQDDLMGG